MTHARDELSTLRASALASRLAVALDAARAAGAVLSRLRGRLVGVEFKDSASSRPIDLVTEADRGAEAAVVSHLRGRFPDDRLIGEEGADWGSASGHDWTWFIDPLDGTTNYVHGLPWFAVSVGALYRGVPAVGVVHAPALGRTWSAATGRGARADGAPMRVSAAEHLADGLLATGFPYDRAETAHALVGPVERALRAARGLRRMGAAALDLAMVADGTFVGYWEPRLKPWDLAAGIVLVREAGGTVTDFDGGDAVLARGDVVASNGPVHSALLEVVRGPEGVG